MALCDLIRGSQDQSVRYWDGARADTRRGCIYCGSSHYQLCKLGEWDLETTPGVTYSEVYRHSVQFLCVLVI